MQPDSYADPYADRYRLLRILGWLISVAIIFVCVWIVVSAVNVSHNTGFLYMKSSDPNASLVVRQPGRQAYLAGVGSADVRLDPGTYDILVSDGIKQSAGTATVYKRQTTYFSLDPTHIVRLPSLESIDFEGMDSLKNVGITESQVSNLEQELFQYKPRSQKISIDSHSVQQEHYNPAYDTGFTVGFDLLIDSAFYSATISYSDLNYVHLLLYDHNHKLVFDSAKYSSPLSGE